LLAFSPFGVLFLITRCLSSADWSFVFVIDIKNGESTRRWRLMVPSSQSPEPCPCQLALHREEFSLSCWWSTKNPWNETHHTWFFKSNTSCFFCAKATTLTVGYT
jgi:hypothetical protein